MQARVFYAVTNTHMKRRLKKRQGISVVYVVVQSRRNGAKNRRRDETRRSLSNVHNVML